jgi:predicted DNA binding CopG/RHH family protein
MEDRGQRTWQEQCAAEQREHPQVFAAYKAFLRAVEEEREPASDRPMIVINDPAAIPRFANEAEEQEYWGTHELGPEMLARARRRQEPRTRPVPIRFDATTLARLRRLAERRGVGYQTLLREFVLERLYEEEIRDGIVTPMRG